MSAKPRGGQPGNKGGGRKPSARPLGKPKPVRVYLDQEPYVAEKGGASFLRELIDKHRLA